VPTRTLVVPMILLSMLAHRSPAQGRVARDSTRRDTLETVVVKAVRATLAAPAAQHVVSRAEIATSFAGQDAPLFLTATPSMTSYSEAGGYSGYSYLRLRGIDQTRLNISLDGVPLNDPEDQVLYFSNVPDFLKSVESVQIQRGVGASGIGTAAYAGSLNFQSVPIATAARGGDLELTAGSFGTQRASAEFASGILSGGWAGYLRASAQRTDGYRRHSGNDSRSAFSSFGWFGERDAVKFTGFLGLSGTRMAYLAASEADLAADRRANPLSDAEGDRFHQEMASVQWTHAFSDAARLSLTGYRNSAAGAFDVAVAPDIDNFYLGHTWHGAVAALSVREGGWSLDAGANASDYHREHAMAVRPALDVREYANVGYKQEQSAFAKVAWDVGPLRLSADLQLRHAAFRYQPSANAGISGASIDWTFVNPKAGVTWYPSQRAGPWTVYASVGRNSREPARGDLFAGADDVNQSNAASVLPLTRVRPERVQDLEAGFTWARGGLSATLNAFDMEFRDEIAAIGALSLTGNPLRRNVDRSYRRGVEFDGAWQVSDRVTASGNLTVMKARIAVYQDEPSGNSYLDVDPLMTPPTIANARVDVRLTPSLVLSVNGRYVDRSYLANDGDAALTLAPSTLADVALTWHRARLDVRLQVFNLLDANASAGGYSYAGERYLYPIAARNFLLTTRIAL
jgi:iron complex outermembrane receptor protein